MIVVVVGRCWVVLLSASHCFGVYRSVWSGTVRVRSRSSPSVHSQAFSLQHAPRQICPDWCRQTWSRITAATSSLSTSVRTDLPRSVLQGEGLWVNWRRRSWANPDGTTSYRTVNSKAVRSGQQHHPAATNHHNNHQLLTHCLMNDGNLWLAYFNCRWPELWRTPNVYNRQPDGSSWMWFCFPVICFECNVLTSVPIIAERKDMLCEGL
jgi:hypothetical protein